MIKFYLNGKQQQIAHLNPNTTVLEYLRLHSRQMDTKEGCASGDCGACTVMAQRLPIEGEESLPFYTLNACITLLSLMDNHHLLTSSYLADNPEHHPERALLHPAQQAMVVCHGSQCGFCTPGFVMSLASVYENKCLQNEQQALDNNLNKNDLSYDDVVAAISGNLCRCTGYRPIIEAGLSMQKIAQQRDHEHSLGKDVTVSLASSLAKDAASKPLTRSTASDSSINGGAIAAALTEGTRQLFIPQSIEHLNQLLSKYPKATIWAGGTDLGLSITQHLIDHEVIIQLSAIESLKSWSLSTTDEASIDTDMSTMAEPTPRTLVFGASMSYANMLPVLREYLPDFAHLFARIASPQIRNMGTLGGNVANASPIGDLPPVLLALDARIHLRHCHSNDLSNRFNTNTSKNNPNSTDEIIPLAEFFLDYKKTKLRAGSYIVAIHIPLLQSNQHLFIHKISKRYEDDISACLLAARFDLSADGTVIEQAKIGLGGMAAVPLLARNCEQAFIGQAVKLVSFEQAAKALPQDVSPMTDVRASREYRMHVVQRLLTKCAKQLIEKTQTDNV